MIEVRGLSKSYGKKQVLMRASLTVPDKSTFGLVGINGAGKSTLLRLIADVLRPDEGGVYVDGENVTDNVRVKRQMFFLPDDPFYAAGTTVEKLACLYRSYYAFDEAAYARWCGVFQVQTGQPLRNFSKGMRRQAFVTLALACRPRYLLLDEAFDGLDPLARLELKRALIELTEERGSTVIISSHSLRELEDICSGFALLDGGTVADAGNLGDALGSVHKFQVALPREARREDFPFECLSFEAMGRVAKFIVRGRREEIEAKLAPLSPLFVEEIAVDFEELFLCEVRSRGYLK